MKWVTRERPKIDRIACPWLIARFIDPQPQFLYVPASEVMRVAARTGAIPFDVPDAELGHHGDRCSFDAFLEKYRLTDPALHKLAAIVRGADTARPELAPEAAGLLAISRGLSLNFADDREMLAHGMILYDALYAWCAGAPLARTAMRSRGSPRAARSYLRSSRRRSSSSRLSSRSRASALETE